MLRASACNNYSPKPSGDAALVVIMAEAQRILRESGRNKRDPRGLRDSVGRSVTFFRILRVGDARREHLLDATANFAVMTMFTTMEMPGPVPLEVARSARARRRGLLGRDGIEGALLLSPASAVHTVGMRFAIDVAYLDRTFRVVAVRTMRPGRIGVPRPRARHVLEAEAGAMERWGLRRGVRIVVRDDA
jgi:uncharacterized membrane protein (UPF0127 family)